MSKTKIKFKNKKIIKQQNGALQASEQEKAIGKIQEADQMGSFLDSAEDIRQDKKNSSRQAYQAKKALEKKEEQGMKMISTRKMAEFFKKMAEFFNLSRLHDAAVASQKTGMSLEHQLMLEFNVVKGLVEKALSQGPVNQKDLPDIVRAQYIAAYGDIDLAAVRGFIDMMFEERLIVLRAHGNGYCYFLNRREELPLYEGVKLNSTLY